MNTGPFGGPPHHQGIPGLGGLGGNWNANMHWGNPNRAPYLDCSYCDDPVMKAKLDAIAAGKPYTYENYQKDVSDIKKTEKERFERAIKERPEEEKIKSEAHMVSFIGGPEVYSADEDEIPDDGPNGFEFTTLDSLFKGRPLSCVTREEWGARPVENITLRTSWPIMTMVLDMSCMSVNIDRCYNKEDCILRVRDLQRYYMDVIGLPDIPYNFLVSHDGTVFEARGWYVQPSPTINSYPLNREARMDIAYIGDYKDTTYPTETTGAVLELMTKGIDMGLVDSFYDAMDHRDGVPDEF